MNAPTLPPCPVVPDCPSCGSREETPRITNPAVARLAPVDQAAVVHHLDANDWDAASAIIRKGPPSGPSAA